MKGMTNKELSIFLELLARLVEAKASTPNEAAAIIREAKPQTKGKAKTKVKKAK